MMRSRTATGLPLDRPARSLSSRGRALGVALDLGTLPASGATMTLAAPAVAATGDVTCPSTDCVRIAPAAGSPVAIASDNAGALYLAYSGGELLNLDLATGALDTVTTGLGNLRGVAVLDQPVARTAETLGIPPGTVKSRTHLALRALRGALAERGYTP